ncbi:hypothetical protein AAG906_027332 [Vitis piasezkii]
MDMLKRHLPISGPEGLHELRKIAERFEEKIYSAATSQMLTMETKSFNVATNSLLSNSAGHSKKSPNDKKSLLGKRPSDPSNNMKKQCVFFFFFLYKMHNQNFAFMNCNSGNFAFYEMQCSQWLLLSFLPLGWKGRVMERSIELIGAMVYDLSSWKHKGGHLDLDDVVPRPHWMTLCTHECLLNMHADGPRFDERSCKGLVATQADNKQHAD